MLKQFGFMKKSNISHEIRTPSKVKYNHFARRRHGCKPKVSADHVKEA